MKKIKNYNSKFKIFILVFIFSTFNFALLTSHLRLAQAVSPAPEATEPAVKELRDKVKEIVQEKLEQTQKGQKMAFFGTISEVNDLNLTLQTNEGDQLLKIATDSALIGKGGKKITTADLKNGLFAIAMGFMGDNQALDVRRLVISEKPKANPREIAFGKVTDISKEENVLTLKNEKQNMLYTVEITSNTTITKKVDEKIQKVKLEAVEIGDRLVAIGTPTENEHKLITAKTLYILPSLSPKTSPTPTAKPTVKTTPTTTKITPTP